MRPEIPETVALEMVSGDPEEPERVLILDDRAMAFQMAVRCVWRSGAVEIVELAVLMG